MAIDDPERAAQQLLECPVGCLFLIAIDRNDLAVEDALTPPRAFALAAAALRELNPWSDQFRPAIEAALAQGPRFADLARRVVNHDGAGWWSEPIARAHQVWVGTGDSPLAPVTARSGDASRLRSWEDYAQRPVGWRLTSTARDGLSCLDVAVACRVGEWTTDGSTRYAVMPVSDDARVYELSGPAEWHELCRSYPSVYSRSDGPASANTLVPRWAAVAEDWDGVHLTFLGLLTTPFVRIVSAAGASMMWSWDTEGTIWLEGAELEPDGLSGPLTIDRERALTGLQTFNLLGLPLVESPSLVRLRPPEE